MVRSYLIGGGLRGLLGGGAGEGLPAIGGLLKHLDADDLSTLWQDSARTTPVTSDSDPVGAWDDKSGNANHCTQATAARRPTYKTSQFGTLAGIDFNASLVHYLGSALVYTGGAITAFFVVDADTTSGIQRLLSSDDTSSGYICLEHVNSSNVSLNDGLAAFSFGAAATGKKVYVFTSADMTAFECYVNTTQLGTSQGTRNRQLDGPTVLGAHYTGGGSPYDGRIAEVAIYNSQLSSADRGDVVTYLRSKWGF